MERNVIWQKVRFDNDIPKINDKTKNLDAMIACRMLGVRSNRTEEFTKAGIIPKIVVFNEQRSDNQEFRIEDFKFLELYNETFDNPQDIDDDENEVGWTASALYNYLTTRQYLIIVFWKTKEGTIFKGCQLWGIDDESLEVVHKAWIKSKLILQEGVKFDIKYNKKGDLKVFNNLPGITDNGVFHIRPHANHAYYSINGEVYGNGKLSDSDLLPNGDRMTKQAYWLNRDFIESQLRPELVMQYTTKRRKKK